GYIEVEFTESAPGFWGVDFPSQPEATQIRLPESAPAAALREAVEEADQQAPAAPHTPNAGEVERLKGEVEALRQQLDSIKHQPAVTPGETEASIPTPPWVAKKAQAEALEAAEIAEHLAKVQDREQTADPDEPAAESEFAAQDLLPKAALDFARADAAIALAPKPQRSVPAGSSRTLRLALLGFLLTAALGGGWYQGWIPGLSTLKPQSSAAARPAPPKPAASGPPAPSVAQNLKPAPANLNSATLNAAAISANTGNPITPDDAPTPTADTHDRRPADVDSEA